MLVAVKELHNCGHGRYRAREMKCFSRSLLILGCAAADLACGTSGLLAHGLLTRRGTTVPFPSPLTERGRRERPGQQAFLSDSPRKGNEAPQPGDGPSGGRAYPVPTTQCARTEGRVRVDS